LGAIPLFLLLARLGTGPYWLATLGIGAAGVWSSNRRAQLLGEKDPQEVVIDEVAGVLIALGMLRHAGLGAKIAGFAAFRALDILKPGIIDRAQRLKPEGVGIMADDVLAGAAAGLAVRLFRYL
jgi:phosphatidylglycerophosphatase A